jgi:hypothetical protein
MSKSKNLKRARLLTKRKREREKSTFGLSQLGKDMQELQAKSNADGFITIEREKLGLEGKISEKVLEMVKPILSKAQNENEVRGALSMGIVAWNLGIVKQVSGEDEMKKMLRSKQALDDPEVMQLMEEHIDIKCKKYGKHLDFITDFKISIEMNGDLNLTVTTSQISADKRTNP